MTTELARPTTPVVPATVSVAGTISDPGGYPLAGIEIALYEVGSDDGVRLDTTITDDVGGYRFARVRATAGDDYRLEARDDSGAHVFTCSTFAIGSDPTTHHTIMPVAGYVQGKVFTQNGSTPAQPATHVSVTAAGAYVVQAVNVSAKGTFRIGGLPAGKYTLLFHDDVHLDDAVSAHWMSVAVAAGRTTTIEDRVLPLSPRN